MTNTLQRKNDYFRLISLAEDMEHLLLKHVGDLSQEDAYLLVDLRSQLLGMSELFLQEDLHRALNAFINSAADEHNRINLSLGTVSP